MMHTYMAITHDVGNTVGSVLAHIWKNAGSVCPCSIMAMWFIFVML